MGGTFTVNETGTCTVNGSYQARGIRKLSPRSVLYPGCCNISFLATVLAFLKPGSVYAGGNPHDHVWHDDNIDFVIGGEITI